MIVFSVIFLMANICTESLINITDPTQTYLDLLEEMQTNNVVNVQKMINLLHAFQDKVFINPIDETDAWSDITKSIYYDLFNKFSIESLDINRINDWLVNNLQNQEISNEIRNKTIMETKSSLFLPLAKLAGGKFTSKMYNNYTKKLYEINANLTYSFYASTTPITRKNWYELIKIYPFNKQKAIKKWAASIATCATPYPYDTEEEIENFPVEVTLGAAMYFANHLSEEFGYRPAYKLNYTTEEEYYYKQGTSLSNKKEEKAIKIAASIDYHADGFRLPFEVEQLYLKQNAKTTDGFIYIDELLKLFTTNYASSNTNFFETFDNYPSLSQYTYTRKDQNIDPGRRTPVSVFNHRPPLLVEGFPFYELFGSIYEWGITGRKINYPNLFRSMFDGYQVNPSTLSDLRSSRLLKDFISTTVISHNNFASWGDDEHSYNFLKENFSHYNSFVQRDLFYDNSYYGFRLVRTAN